MTAQYTNIRVTTSQDRIICDRIAGDWTKTAFPIAEIQDGKWAAINVPPAKKLAKEHTDALDSFLVQTSPATPNLEKMTPAEIAQAMTDVTGATVSCSLTNSGHISVEHNGLDDLKIKLKKVFKIQLKQSTFYRGLKIRKAG